MPISMLYAASKILGFLLQPSSLAVIAVAVGLWRMSRTRSRRGGRLAGAGAAYLAIGGLSPLGNALILPLEQRFPPVEVSRLGEIAGVIILGGAEDGRISEGRGGLGLNEAAERITEGARLAKLFPQAKIVFTGGVGRLWFGGTPGAGPVARFLTGMGVSPERIVLEDKSRNTRENAALTRDLLKPASGERWVLVTSAYHMPRAVGVFRRAGFDVLPFPVDFRTKGWEDAARPFDGLPDGLERVDVAVREWAGLAAYWLLGYTSALFPGLAAP